MKERVTKIVLLIRTVAQRDPKTTRIVLFGGVAFLVAKLGFNISPELQGYLIMAILALLGINAGDSGKTTKQETVTVLESKQITAPSEEVALHQDGVTTQTVEDES
jgi:hypothetical protein